MNKRDYYEILGLNKTATSDEIKKAYRKKSMETHPDRGGNEELFKEIAEAYEHLSDPKKKENYDRYGHNTPKGNPFGGQNGFNRFSEFFSNSSFNPFGGRQTRRGNDLNLTIKLTLEEILNGTTKKIKYKRKSSCVKCSGIGGTGKKTCQNCQGAGMVGEVINTPFGQIRNATECHICNGEGTVYSDMCLSCHGHGVVDFEEVVDINIPHGVPDNIRMGMDGRGNAVKNGIPGNLIITIMELPHDKFVRVGNDLRINTKLTYPQLVLGDKVEIPTIDGTKIRINVEPFTKVNETLRIQGKGIKQMNTNNRGDMLVVIDLDMPTKLSDEETKLIEELKKIDKKVVA